MHTPEPRIMTARQRELFDAILTTFLREGFATFTIDSATKRFRCSKSTLYALGATRDEVIRRILVSFFREVARSTDAAAAGRRTDTGRLKAYFSAMTSSLEPASPAFMRDVSTEPVAREVYATNTRVATERITSIIDSGIDSGEFRPGPTKFLAEIIRVAMERIEQGGNLGEVDPRHAYEELGRLVLHGIAQGR